MKYNTADNIEDLDVKEELLSFDTVIGVEENHQIMDEEHQNADFKIYVRDFSELDKIRELLLPFGMKAYVDDDQTIVTVEIEALEFVHERQPRFVDPLPGVMFEVIAERKMQDCKWGEQNHDPFFYLAILMEEVGEASQAALEAAKKGRDWRDYRAELIQVAAVAVAMVECYDRNEESYLSNQTA